MAIKYVLKAKTGTYKDGQGNEKTAYVKCGVIMDGKNGPIIKLEALPIVFDGWLYLSPPEEKPRGRPQPRPQQSNDGFDDEDIPF